jgi:hypothetical protein
LDNFALICKGIKASWLKQVGTKIKRKVTIVQAEDKPLLFLPEDGGTVCKSDPAPADEPDFILVACAGHTFAGHFSELIKDGLIDIGVAVKVALTGQQFSELQSAVNKCKALILIMADGDDLAFINRILHGARFSTEVYTRDAIEIHAFVPLEANTHVANGIPLGSSLLLPVHTVNCVQTL